MEQDNIAQKARRATKLSQEGFAKTFRIPLSTVRKNEQSVNGPRKGARVYYELIAAYPAEMADFVAQLPQSPP